MHYLFSNFLTSKEVGSLRSLFDRRMQNPLRSNPERFVWDFWHVPNEYTLLRTPAWEYFPQKIWQPVVAKLHSFAQNNFGCRHLSPIWLSNYVSGCRQFSHKDEPHGPWAFVLPLNVEKKFSGGETFIWQGNRKILVKPEFNRLLVFNPSLPHGVEEVKKNLDPRAGRLVLHGWFTDPKPFFQGAGVGAVSHSLNQFYLSLGEMHKALPKLNGFIAWHLHIKNGLPYRIEQLPHTLFPNTQAKKFIQAAKILMGELKFPKNSKRITIPFWM